MSIDTASLTAAIGSVNAAISTVGTLDNASPVVLATVYLAAVSARAPFDAAIDALNDVIDVTDIGGVADGAPGPVSAAELLAQADAVAQQGVLVVAEAYLARATANLWSAANGRPVTASSPSAASSAAMLSGQFTIGASGIGGPDGLA